MHEGTLLVVEATSLLLEVVLPLADPLEQRHRVRIQDLLDLLVIPAFGDVDGRDEAHLVIRCAAEDYTEKFGALGSVSTTNGTAAAPRYAELPLGCMPGRQT